jgi:alpha-amylase
MRTCRIRRKVLWLVLQRYARPQLSFGALRHEIEKIVNFWLERDRRGRFRLDAARHIYPDWEKELSIEFWEFFSKAIEKVKPEAFTVAEVWAETEEVARI